MSHHSHCKKRLPNVQSKSTLFQFKTTAPCPVTTGLGKKSISIFLISPLQVVRGHNQVSLKPSPGWTLLPFLIAKVFQPSDQLLQLSFGPALAGPCLSYAGDPRARHSTPVAVSHEQRIGENYLPWPAGHASFHAAQDTFGKEGPNPLCWLWFWTRSSGGNINICLEDSHSVCIVHSKEIP